MAERRSFTVIRRKLIESKDEQYPFNASATYLDSVPLPLAKTLKREHGQLLTISRLAQVIGALEELQDSLSLRVQKVIITQGVYYRTPHFFARAHFDLPSQTLVNQERELARALLGMLDTSSQKTVLPISQFETCAIDRFPVNDVGNNSRINELHSWGNSQQSLVFSRPSLSTLLN